MRNSGRWSVAILITAGLVLSGCQSVSQSEPDQEAPAVIGEADDNGVKSVKLTRQASDRLGIETIQVRESPTATPSPAVTPMTVTPMTVVPYSAVLYVPDGTTWVYTVPQPLTYIRETIVVATVGGADGTEAFLSAGPPVGTTIVTVGVMELYGAELGVGE